MLYEFKVSHKTVEETKNICCMKAEEAVEHSTINKWLKIFCLGWEKLNDQRRLGRPKTMHSDDVLQTVAANLVSSTQRVSGKLSISQSRVVPQLHNFGKCIKICWIIPHITKILQNIWLTQVLIICQNKQPLDLLKISTDIFLNISLNLWNQILLIV